MMVKLALVGLASAAVTGLAVLMIAWWNGPIERLSGVRFMPNDFGESGVVPLAYAAFAFALGVACGVFIRRTLPAMAATLVGFIGVRIGATFWVRPHLMAPIRKSVDIQSAAGWGLGPDPSGHGVRFFVEAPSIANAGVFGERHRQGGKRYHESVHRACLPGHRRTDHVWRRRPAGLPVGFQRLRCEDLIRLSPGPRVSAGRSVLAVPDDGSRALPGGCSRPVPPDRLVGAKGVLTAVRSGAWRTTRTWPTGFGS